MEEKQETKEVQNHCLDYLIIFLKRKKLIMAYSFTAAAVCALIAFFLLSDIFMSETRIMPPQQPTAAASQLLSQFREVCLSAVFSGAVQATYMRACSKADRSSMRS